MSIKDGCLTEMEWASLRRTAEETTLEPPDALDDADTVVRAIRAWRPKASKATILSSGTLCSQVRYWIDEAKAGRGMYVSQPESA